MNNLIYTVVDRQYERYARACFNSIVVNYPDHPLVQVAYTEISDEFKQFVSQLPQFELVLLEKNQSRLTHVGPVNNPIVYQRLALWSSAFDQYDNILHLDVDTLVLRPLDHLFQQQDFLIINNNEVLEGLHFLRWDKGVKTALQQLLIEPEQIDTTKFANAGVFVIPKKYRTSEQQDNIWSIAIGMEKFLTYADQSIINLWLLQQQISFSEQIEDNFQPPFFNYPDNQIVFDDINILHFTARKPDTVPFLLWWRLKNVALDLHNLYQKYLNHA